MWEQDKKKSDTLLEEFDQFCNFYILALRGWTYRLQEKVDPEKITIIYNKKEISPFSHKKCHLGKLFVPAGIFSHKLWQKFEKWSWKNFFHLFQQIKLNKNHSVIQIFFSNPIHGWVNIQRNLWKLSGKTFHVACSQNTGEKLFRSEVIFAWQTFQIFIIFDSLND